MKDKRYAIVRVDDKCPYIVEDFDSTETNNMFKCYDVCKKFRNGSCKTVCRYGDTKEQLIRKVATVILRTLKDGEVLKYEEFGTGFIKQPVSIEYLAEKIVEFLGVE